VAGNQNYPAGALYVVATPIGNLADLSLRAVQVLALVDAVACEDTRVSAGLLGHLGLRKPLLAVHEHNEASAAQAVIERLERGERIAYVSDAGTPAVSDPGAVLVARVREHGLRVVPLPGASSVLVALSAAGDVVGATEAAGGGFHVRGFLPAKGQDRARALDAVAAQTGAVVLFEAPHRIEALARSLAEAMPTRTLTVCRELTKQFEDIRSMPSAALPAWLAEHADHRRGEFVLVLHSLAPVEVVDTALAPEVERLLSVLMAELPLKQAVALTVQASGVPRNVVYPRALALRDAHDAGEVDQAGEAADDGDASAS
jgi:16S rRNA (cytidine1402-2'-O)-methyltransferase